MSTAGASAGVHWSEVGRTIRARHRTLRLMAEAARGVARAVLQGDELGMALLPYAILGLERAVEVQFSQEQQQLLPLLETQWPDGQAVADGLRSTQDHVRQGLAELGRAGTREALVVGQALHVLTGALLSHLSEQDAALWADDGGRERTVQMGEA